MTPAVLKGFLLSDTNSLFVNNTTNPLNNTSIIILFFFIFIF